MQGILLGKAGRWVNEREQTLDAGLKLVHEKRARNQVSTDQWHGEFRNLEQVFAHAYWRVDFSTRFTWKDREPDSSGTIAASNC